MAAWFDAEVFRKAQLSTRHLTDLVPVARPTVSRWLNGRAHPDELLRSIVLPLQTAIVKALEDEALPAKRPKGCSRYEYDLRIRATIKNYLNAQPE